MLGAETFDEVLLAAQAGAGWAFRALWDDLAPVVTGYLRGRGAGEPDELTNEVFLAAFTRIERFVGGEAAFRSYVFTIAHHRLVDDLRRRSRRRETSWDTTDDLRTTRSAEEDALVEVGAEEVERALALLSEDQRDVLALRILGDLTVEQVAEVVGKRPGAVKALQRRGLDTLRRRMSTGAVSLGLSRSMRETS